MPVAVARREVHRREATAGAQRGVDRALLLDHLRPVDRLHPPHAGDDVAHRDVGRRLVQVLVGDDAICVGACRGESAVEPRQRRGRVRVVVAQPHHQLGRERLRQRFVVAVAPPQRALGAAVVGQHRGGEQVGRSTIVPMAHDAGGGAAQVLDQHQPQRGRQRPEFGDRQRLFLLVGVQERGQGCQFDAAVGVGDHRPGDRVDARIADQGPGRQRRQAAEARARLRRVDRVELGLDDVEVVDQPFRRRGHGALVLQRTGHQGTTVPQLPRVVVQSRDQRVAVPGHRPVAVARRQLAPDRGEGRERARCGTDHQLVGRMPATLPVLSQTPQHAGRRGRGGRRGVGVQRERPSAVCHCRRANRKWSSTCSRQRHASSSRLCST